GAPVATAQQRARAVVGSGVRVGNCAALRVLRGAPRSPRQRRAALPGRRRGRAAAAAPPAPPPFSRENECIASGSRRFRRRGDGMPKSWSKKRERQYEHIKRSAARRGRSSRVAKRIPPAPPNKTRPRQAETPSPRPQTPPP